MTLLKEQFPYRYIEKKSFKDGKYTLKKVFKERLLTLFLTKENEK